MFMLLNFSININKFEKEPFSGQYTGVCETTKNNEMLNT